MSTPSSPRARSTPRAHASRRPEPASLGRRALSAALHLLTILALLAVAFALGAAATIHAYDLAVPAPVVRIADQLCARLATAAEPPAVKSDPLPNKLFSERLLP